MQDQPLHTSPGQRNSKHERLEQELEQARRHGRWLADDEIAAIEQQHRDQVQRHDRQRQQRRKLLLLTGLCALIPPFWPLALGLVLYLLFPRTTQRFGVIAGIVVLSVAALVTVLLVTLLAVVLAALL